MMTVNTPQEVRKVQVDEHMTRVNDRCGMAEK